MANVSLGTVLHHVEVMAAAQAGERSSDAELLEDFLNRRDQMAFAALVLRHGPMVLNVCRRVLGQRHDAEDAFQATFLILARKAASVRQRPALASWLYGTAYRMAMSIKRAAARRRVHEGRARALAPSDPCADLAWREVQVLLDEEFHRLPEKYRMVFVLCCLESKPRLEVARLLGVKEGTVSSRLDQARKQLQTRLARRGVTLSGVLAATALTQPAGSAAVPAAVFAITVRAAATLPAGQGIGARVVSARVAALVEAGLKTMVTVKQIATVLILVLAMVAGGTGLILCQSPAARAPDDSQVEQSKPVAQRADLPPPAEAKLARTDRFGDPLPAGALARLGTVRWRHGSQVMAIAYAPDGKTLASASMDEAIHLWDTKTGKLLRRFEGHSGWVALVFFTPNGKNLISWGWDRTARVWDIPTGKELRRWTTETGGWQSALSPDGKLLATPGAIKETIDLWDVATGKKVGELAAEGEQDYVVSLAFSPDGKQLASGGGTMLRLFDVATGEQLHAFGKGKRINSLAFSADGKALAVGRYEEPATIWDLATLKPLRGMAGNPIGDRVVAFSPDDKTLAVFGHGPAALWDVATGKKVHELPGPLHQVWTAAFSPDGKTLAVGNLASRILLMDAATGKELPSTGGHREWLSFLAFVDGGRRLATASSDGLVRVWDRASGETVKEFQEGGSGCYCGDMSPDGRTLALGAEKGPHLFDWTTGKTLHRLKGHERQPFAMAFSARGNMLASAAHLDQDIILWDPAAGKELRRIRAPPQLEPSCLAWSPNGKILAFGGGAANPKGKMEDNICLWDAAAGKQLLQWTAQPWPEKESHLGTPAAMNALAFSPDGALLASANADQTVGLWEVANGRLRMRLRGHQQAVTALAFTPDGRMLASGGQDCTIRLWEVSTGKERRSFEGHLGSITRLAFSADGLTLTSASGDTSVLVWPVWGPSGQPLKKGE